MFFLLYWWFFFIIYLLFRGIPISSSWVNSIGDEFSLSSFSENICFLSLFQKNIFSGYWFLDWHFFSSPFIFPAALGLRWCAQVFRSCSEWGPLLAMVCEPLTVLTPPIEEHELQMHGPQHLQNAGPVALAHRPQILQVPVVVVHGFSSCGSRALELRLSSCGTWT